MYKNYEFNLKSLIATIIATTALFTSNPVAATEMPECSSTFTQKPDILNRYQNQIPNPEDTEYFRKKNSQVQTLISKSDDFKAMRELIEKDVYTDNYTKVFYGQKYFLETDAKTFEQVIYREEKNKRVKIFSTFDLGKKNGSLRISSFSTNPSGVVAILTYEFGSIDKRKVLFVDKNSKVFKEIGSASDAVGWAGPNEFLLKGAGVGSDGIDLYLRLKFENNNLKEDLSEYIDNHIELISSTPEYTYTLEDVFNEELYKRNPNADPGERIHFRYNKKTGEKVVLKIPFQISRGFAGGYKGKLYYVGTPDRFNKTMAIFTEDIVPTINTSIKTGDRPNTLLQAARASHVELPFDYDLITNVRVLNKTLVINYWKSGRSFVGLYDIDSKRTQVIEIPDANIFLDIKFESEKVIELKVSNPINPSSLLRYDLQSQRYTSDLSQLFTNKEGEFKSEIVWYTSFDGTKVPMRISQRKTSVTNHGKPVFMQAYGDYNEPTYMVRGFDAETYQFIKDGGILAEPAIRGGGELGLAWHKAGYGLNRDKSYEDLASAAKYLIDNRITERKLIVLRGASSGGLAVAATALFFPEYFGLAIPENAIADVENAVELEHEYPWYGDVSQEDYREFWKNLSPLRNAHNIQDLKFLIINGRMDTRVNPKHSVLLAQALEKFAKKKDQVLMVSTNSSGHFSYSPKYNGKIGIYTAAVKWTYIYNYLKMKINKP